MQITGDQLLIKKLNRSIVLDHIRRQSPVSRAALAQMTGLTKATVSSLVAELLDNHLALEIGTGQSSGGRRPVMLLFNQTAGYSIGVDLGVDYIHGVLCDLQGEIIQECRVALEHTDLRVALEIVKDCIRTLQSSAPLSPYGLVGIGIGVPGITDGKGTLLFAPNLGWKQVPLQELLQEEFQVPVSVDNEANMGAVGEQQYGAGREAANLVYVSVGAGIGTGILIRGELYRGAGGFAGEMGHFTVDSDGERCRCGSRGCWELYASEQALLQRASAVKSLVELGRPVTLELLAERAEQGRPEPQALLEETGRQLGIGLVNIINIFNPEQIIIGNRLTAAAAWLEAPIHREVDSRVLPEFRRHLTIRFAQLGERSAVLGAAFLAVSSFFSGMTVTVGQQE